MIVYFTQDEKQGVERDLHEPLHFLLALHLLPRFVHSAAASLASTYALEDIKHF